MRELKFRAWDSKNKRFVNIVRLIFDQFGALDYAEVVFNGKIYKLYSSEIVLEQDTGLKDKNGTEISEGDIVFFFTEHFDKATGGFDGEDEHNATVEWFDNGLVFMDKIPYDPNIECEVIGNIHENPELLEEEGK